MAFRGKFWSFVLAIILLLPCTKLGLAYAQAAAAVAKRALTVDDYFDIKTVSDPQISPEGKWIAYTVTTPDLKEDKNKERIWMVATSGGEAIALTSEGVSSNHPRWSPDGRYLAFLSERDEGQKQVWLLNREGGEAQQLTEAIQDVDSFAWSPESDRLVLVLRDPSQDEIAAAKNKDSDKSKAKPHPIVVDRLHFKEDEVGYLDRRRTHLYVFKLSDHHVTQITSGDYDDADPAWSPDGRLIAFSSNRTEEPDSNFNSDIWTVAADNADRGKNLTRVTKNPGPDSSPAWSPDGKWIAYATETDVHAFEYATQFVGVAPAAGGEAKVLSKALDRWIYHPKFSHDGKWIYFVVVDDGTQRLARIPAAGGEINFPIGGRLTVNSFSMSKDDAIAADIGVVDRPNEIYFLAPGADSAPRRLTTTNDALMAKLKLGEVEYIHFKSKDGTPVAGYLTRPPDFKPGQRYPAVLVPHGGPQEQYSAEFDFRAQMIAANGYAVLTPNPRGSIGYGQKFCEAIFADWGNTDYQDDMASVDYAISEGIADGDKLGVGGHSYGAISTNFIITQTTRFKAAVSNAGEFLYITNWGHDLYSREWEYELGLPWENRALWEKISPFNRVLNIKTPTLIMGGDVDWNVPIINGEQMYQSLKRLGVPTMLVVYPGEYHEIARPSFIKDRDTRWIFWFNHYVKGEGPAAPPASDQAE
jgi:dipeptidyl aminopeptidase/acylaminoacyl peptidase